MRTARTGTRASSRSPARTTARWWAARSAAHAHAIVSAKATNARVGGVFAATMATARPTRGVTGGRSPRTDVSRHRPRLARLGKHARRTVIARAASGKVASACATTMVIAWLDISVSSRYLPKIIAPKVVARLALVAARTNTAQARSVRGANASATTMLIARLERGARSVPSDRTSAGRASETKSYYNL